MSDYPVTQIADAMNLRDPLKLGLRKLQQNLSAVDLHSSLQQVKSVG